MRYLGSKSSVVDAVFGIADSRVRKRTLCDPFGGIGIVSGHFKSLGYRVVAGDVLAAPHCFQVARLEFSSFPRFDGLCNHVGVKRAMDIASFLNSLEVRYDTWFVREYSIKRRFFSEENAAKIDACRRAINRWVRREILSAGEAEHLRASLIESMDRVANTAGTYYAYLKELYRKAQLPFRFSFVEPISGPRGRAKLGSAAHVVCGERFGVLYLDPPYNGRRYHRYYHLPETIALGVTPPVFGASGSPKRAGVDETFYQRSAALPGLASILENASYELLIFHYSDDGMIKKDDIRPLLRRYGKLQEFTLDALGYGTEGGKRSVMHRLYVVTA